jgi:voltage-gated potassium channel
MPLILITRWLKVLRRVRARTLIAVAVGVLLTGAVLFSLFDHVSFGLALYWAITTATTVGYGDVTPHNTASRIIASVVMLTTIPTVAAVFALMAGASVLAHIRRLLGMDSHLPTGPYTIVFGSHPIVSRVIDELCASGDPVVHVATERPASLHEAVHFIAGDPTDEALLLKCEPHRANRALIACAQEADTLVIAVAIHGNAPGLETFALTQSRAVARALHELGVTHTLAADELVGHAVAKGLETPQSGSVLLQLLDSTNYRMAEKDIDESLISEPLSKARGMAGALVLGIARTGGVDLGVGDDPVLAAGDRLIVLEAV